MLRSQKRTPQPIVILLVWAVAALAVLLIGVVFFWLKAKETVAYERAARQTPPPAQAELDSIRWREQAYSSVGNVLIVSCGVGLLTYLINQFAGERRMRRMLTSTLTSAKLDSFEQERIKKIVLSDDVRAVLEQSIAGEIKRQMSSSSGPAVDTFIGNVVAQINQHQAGLVSVGKLGIVSAVPELRVAQLDEVLGDKSLRFDMFQTWIPDWQVLEKTILDALTSGATVRLVLLKAGSPTLAERAKAFGIGGDHGEGYVKLNFDHVASLKTRAVNAKLPGTLQLRYWSGSASVPVYASDNVVVFGVFWMHERSYNGPHFIAARASPLGGYLSAHFDKLWEMSEPSAL